MPLRNNLVLQYEKGSEEAAREASFVRSVPFVCRVKAAIPSPLSLVLHAIVIAVL